MVSKIGFFGFASFVIVVLACSSIPVARAAGSLIVNNLGDTTGACAATGIGTCTLRDAILYANATTDANDITFGVSGTITLGSDSPTITDAVTINGSGQRIVINGADTYRILTVNRKTRVNLRALTLQHGYSDGEGGAIVNHGILTIARSVLSYNQAPYGGAIYNAGKLSINTSAFQDNVSAVAGGGIYSEGKRQVLVMRSRFSMNQADASFGGAIHVKKGLLIVTNSTFDYNSAKDGGGGIYGAGRVYLTNSTLYKNMANSHGDGVYNADGSFYIRNTILASDMGKQCFDESGTLEITRFNLATDDSCGSMIKTGLGKIALDVPRDNGGPTDTIALGRWSLALDAGDPNVCMAPPNQPFYGADGRDQRGVKRPQKINCDIGAYESAMQKGRILVVNDSADTSDSTCEMASKLTNCTLREALAAADDRLGGAIVTFDIPSDKPNCIARNQCTILLTAELHEPLWGLTIDGAANDGKITIDGANHYSHLHVRRGVRINLNALNLVNGSGLLDGGGLVNYGGILHINNSTVAGNGGGGYYSLSSGGLVNFGTAAVTNSTFFGNSGSGYGGGILNRGTLTVVNSTILGNKGFGIDTPVGSTIIRNSIVAGNDWGDCSGTVTADSHNLDSDGSCSRAKQKTLNEIRLGPLQDNGGPTLTMKPGDKGSAAVDAGKNKVCAEAVGRPTYGAGGYDQRGVTRPQFESCDLGSVEFQ